MQASRYFVRKILSVVGTTLALGILGCSSSGSAERSEEIAQRTTTELPEATRLQAMQETIKALYARLTLYSQATHDAEAGAKLEFELGNFRLLEPADYAELRWNELVTLPSGAVVDVTREVATAASGARGVRYEPRWNQLPESPAMLPDGVSADSVSVAEALARASESNPELAEIRAITSFDVEVRLDGQTRTYRAAVLWQELPFAASSAPSDEAAFFAIDNITQGVHEVGIEGETAAVEAAPPSPQPALDPRGDDKGKGVCVPSSRVYLETPQEQRKGKYVARAEFRGECSCDAACVTRCESSIVSKTCKYDSWTGFCRKMDENTEVMAAVNEAGGVKCAAGLACAGKGCFLCLCFSTSVKATVKITKISALEVKVDFSFESASWKAGLKAEWMCADCRTLGAVNASMRFDRHSSDGFNEGFDESVCGDTLCDGPETCGNCSQDCGPCGPVCGNGVCQPGETCSNCPTDCGPCVTCGDGACQAGETCNNCPTDCGPCTACGNGTCQPGENCGNCPSDCGSCCGNGVCQGGETCSNCPSDCGTCGPVCGDGVCAPGQEDCGTCLTDCPCWDPNFPICQNRQCVAAVQCGNGICQPGENCGNCPSDCGSCCGNGVCQGGETCSNCPSDCGTCGPVCGDGVCAPGQEDCGTCLTDCPCWDPSFPICQNRQCVAAIECGNNSCEAGEYCWNCEQDCGPCSQCGDGSCDYDEDCWNCQTDCGYCPP